MKLRIIAVVLGILAVAFLYSPAEAQEQPRVVSPLICGANTMYDFAGFYYGTLPESNPASKRKEFIELLHKINIHTLRFPGGTYANSKYLADHLDIMQSVLKVGSIPEGDPQKVVSFWQYLDFCKEADITPMYQLNMLLYTDGKKVYQLVKAAGAEGFFPPPPAVTYDPSKRNDAAKALTELVKKVREKGYTLKNWELGNEEYGHPIMKADDYANMARRYIRAIRAADPDAMIWVTLGSNHCDEWTKKNVIPWSRQVLKRLKEAGLTKDKNLGFTLHYVWPGYFIDFHEQMLKEFGFQPRLAVTEFHMAGLGEYWDLSPRFGYALELAPYLIGMACIPCVEMVDIHELTSQNFGILHYNQRSYGPPTMETWDASLGYQLMPSAHVYELFGQLVGGTILPIDRQGDTLLVVEKGKERLIFLVNRTVNPVTFRWGRDVVGNDTKQYQCRSMVPVKMESTDSGEVSAQALGRSAYPGDPLRADQIAWDTQSGVIGEKGLSLTVPPYSITLIRCTPAEATTQTK